MATAVSTIFRTPQPVSGFQWRARPRHTAIWVLTVDQNPLVREGLAAVINREPGMVLAAQASTGAEAIDLYRKYRPGVITLDPSLPDMQREEFVTRLLVLGPPFNANPLTPASSRTGATW